MMHAKFPDAKRIILFDGVCNLCNGVVQYIIAHDKSDVFRFAALQSETGHAILADLGLEASKTESIILYIPDRTYFAKSNAVIEIVGSFGGWFRLLKAFKIFPTGFRDFIYDFVARNRYKWYGKRENCMIPTPELRKKFL